MLNIEVVSIKEEEKWDEIVKTFENYDVCYLSGYSKAFQLHGDGEPFLFYYDDGSTRGINVLMKRDIAKLEYFKDTIPSNTWFDLSSPYGYGGFLIEGDDMQTVYEAYSSYCKDKGFVCEFIRFHLFNDSHNGYRGEYKPSLLNIVRDLEMPVEEIIMDFEHRARKNLKKALKADLKIEIDNEGKRLDEFLNIYYGTMNRNDANKSYMFSKEFFQEINKMKDNYVYVHVLYQGKVISTELVLYGPKHCYSFLGGTDSEYFHLQPNTLLKYEIIKWAKEKKLANYILGGGYGAEDGIYKYKKSFAPNGVKSFFIGNQVINIDKYNYLCATRQESNREQCVDFFPAYRG